MLLAPGAHDRPVAFPGWTLPGVITAGGAQTLVKTQRVLPGERLVFAGSGPLALAFPAQLHGYGATIVAVLEAGPPPGPRDVAADARGRARQRGLLRDAARYRAQLLRARVPLRYRRIVVRAEGDGRVEAVTHAAVDADWRVDRRHRGDRVDADTLCVGYGFVPSVELLRLAGCAFGYDEDLGGPVVDVDEWMRTSVEGVLAAGDGTGVEGVYVAVDEGRLAALGAALDLGDHQRSADDAPDPGAARAQARVPRARCTRMHRIGPGVYELADAATVVCRCEEVTRAHARRGDRRPGRHQRREGLHPRGDGPLPGPQLPAPGRGDDRDAPRRRGRRRRARDAARCRPGRSRWARSRASPDARPRAASSERTC